MSSMTASMIPSAYRANTYVMSFSTQSDTHVLPFTAAYSLRPHFSHAHHTRYIVHNEGHNSIVSRLAPALHEPITRFFSKSRDDTFVPPPVDLEGVQVLDEPQQAEALGYVAWAYQALTSAAVRDIFSFVDRAWRWSTHHEERLTHYVESVPPTSKGLFVFLHALHLSPSQGIDFIESLREEPDITYYFPKLPYAGNASKEELVPPVLNWIRRYHERFPDNPIVIAGASNGCRIGDEVIARLTTGERPIDADLLVVRMASAAAGTRWINMVNRFGLWTHLDASLRQDMAYEEAV